MRAADGGCGSKSADGLATLTLLALSIRCGREKLLRKRARGKRERGRLERRGAIANGFARNARRKAARHALRGFGRRA
jgi:hypothetical protein